MSPLPSSPDPLNNAPEDVSRETRTKLDGLRQEMQSADGDKEKLAEVKAKARALQQELEEQDQFDDASEASAILEEIDAVDGNNEEDAENSKPETPLNKAKKEVNSFMKKFNDAKGAEKLTIVIEKFGEIAEKIGDFLSKIGSSTLLNVATLLERFKVVDQAWIDQLRIFAGSEKAVLQESFKKLNLILVKDPAGKDKEALIRLRELYNIEKTKQPAGTPYSFEKYVAEVVEAKVAGKFGGNEADSSGRKKVTLKQIIEKLTA